MSVGTSRTSPSKVSYGALLKTLVPLNLGTLIKLHVHLTGKSADARVVFVSNKEALHFGIALDRPENIWGISLTPTDWDTRASDQ